MCSIFNLQQLQKYKPVKTSLIYHQFLQLLTNISTELQKGTSISHLTDLEKIISFSLGTPLLELIRKHRMKSTLSIVENRHGLETVHIHCK